MADSHITKNALATAMKQLMETTPFAKISVGEICERCQMNRKSFYYHFKDKYDLVNWIFYTEFIGAVQMKDYADGWAFFDDICAYFYENRPFYTNALQVQGQDSVRDYFKEILQTIMRGYMKDFLREDKNASFFAVFFADAFAAAIERWLTENPPMPPGEFVSLLKTALGGVPLQTK